MLGDKIVVARRAKSGNALKFPEKIEIKLWKTPPTYFSIQTTGGYNGPNGKDFDKFYQGQLAEERDQGRA